MKYLITIILSMLVISCSDNDLGDVCGRYKYYIENSCITTINITSKSNSGYQIELVHDDYTASPDNRRFILEGSFSNIPSDSIKNEGRNIGFVSFTKDEITVISTINNKTYFGQKYE